jgi:hypothetical protein
MQVVELRPANTMRRWCRECGMPSPASEPCCTSCGVSPRAPRPTQVQSKGEVVQHFNIENVQHLAVANDLRETREALEAQVQAIPKESFLKRFLMFSCTVAIWTSILTVLSVVAFFGWVIYMAYAKAHGHG